MHHFEWSIQDIIVAVSEKSFMKNIKYWKIANSLIKQIYLSKN